MYQTHPLSKECDRFANFAQACFYAVVIRGDGHGSRLLLPFELIEDDFVLDTSSFGAQVISIVYEVVESEVGHVEVWVNDDILHKRNLGVVAMHRGRPS